MYIIDNEWSASTTVCILKEGDVQLHSQAFYKTLICYCYNKYAFLICNMYVKYVFQLLIAAVDTHHAACVQFRL